MLDNRDVWIVDVAPRDGLQNDPGRLSTQEKIELILGLFRAGIYRVEIGSFVNPEKVPTMADVEAVAQGLPAQLLARSTALVPNERGYDRALRVGLKDLRFVVAVSSTMHRKNFNREPEDTLRELQDILGRPSSQAIKVGVVLATAFGCPYEGLVNPEAVRDLALKVADLGVSEVLLADTTGMAAPLQVGRLAETLLSDLSSYRLQLGLHLHNTRNLGYANAYAGWSAGIRLFDASLGGIGGCPFAPQAMGNIATEDLVGMFEGMRVTTGVHLGSLLSLSGWLGERLGHPLPSLLPKAGPVPWLREGTSSVPQVDQRR